jgi:hypothetical protein
MESLLLRMDAIKIVNKRIAEADGHVSDGTIGAVASLVTYEVRFLPVFVCQDCSDISGSRTMAPSKHSALIWQD